MITDITDYAEGELITGDLCIIGAGPAGISIAREFDGTGQQVILLESGGRQVEQEQQNLVQGEVTGIEYKNLTYNRLRMLGGTTGHWAGQSLPLDPLDFVERPWVPHSGWPIPYEELTRYLPEAAKVCGLGPEPFTFEEWSERTGVSSPFEGLDVAALRFSTPVARFGQTYGPQLEASENIRCVLHACAQALQPSSDGRRVQQVEAKSLEGRRILVKADRFVLATGAIENARMLLLSQESSGAPFGNAHDNVGRFLMEHPRVDTSHVVLERRQAAALLAKADRDVDSTRIRFDVKLPRDVQEKEKVLNHSAFLALKAKPSKSSRGVRHLLDGLAEETEFEQREFKLRIRLEHSPLRSSRVTLADTLDGFGRKRVALHFDVGALEERTVDKVEQALARHLGVAQVGRMRMNHRKRRWKKNIGWQDHQMGGTRMSTRPEDGVVDSNCLVHGMANLYTAGASVFPTSGHANPTMNLVAMSLRLARHLMEASP